ncbi:hypothetical protein P7C73_g5168, partial [Tremellales sp. Uapishka_1]
MVRADTPPPKLPFEILRRVIDFHLSLPPSASIDPDDWDNLAGQRGRQLVAERIEMQKKVRREVVCAMSVCRAWKTVAQKYLYTEPHLSSNLDVFASCLVRGDKKWTDLHSSPFSLPGRYLAVLDLSDPALNSTLHYSTISSILVAIFPLVPNLTHLKLPNGPIPFPLVDLQTSPFISKLRVLEGLQVVHQVSRDGKDPLVEILRHAPALQFLSVYGGGHAHLGLSETDFPQDALNLPSLHTLVIDGVIDGLLIETLIKSHLPRLAKLAITSYHLFPSDQTLRLQQTHGAALRSLTYLNPRDWPALQVTPSSRTLDLHPALRHLSFLGHHAMFPINIILGARINNHPLEQITLSRFTWRNRTSENEENRLLECICKTPPPGLRRLRIDGFRWVKNMSKAAMETGHLGAMRKWEGRLRAKGIEMMDSEGRRLENEGGREERTRRAEMGCIAGRELYLVAKRYCDSECDNEPVLSIPIHRFSIATQLSSPDPSILLSSSALASPSPLTAVLIISDPEFAALSSARLDSNTFRSVS